MDHHIAHVGRDLEGGRGVDVVGDIEGRPVGKDTARRPDADLTDGQELVVQVQLFETPGKRA